MDAEGSWKAELLSAFHNGVNPAEVERLKSEHPNEPDCVTNGRVLGGIAVTRGIPLFSLSFSFVVLNYHDSTGRPHLQASQHLRRQGL